jgi:methylamine utilization protein MauE
MLELALRCALALVLLFAAASKLVAPGSSQAALVTFGLRGPGVRRAAWAALLGAEVALAAALVAGVEAAPYAGTALMLGFALALVVAIRRGRSGAPCSCFGSRSTVGWPAVGRNLGLAAALAALPLLPSGEPSTDEWLGLGLGISLAACLALGVGVMALAREVGMLRLQLGPQSALEIVGEGPELGSRVSLVGRLEPVGRAELGLAVFTSPGCHVCQALEPAVDSLARDPLVAVEVFDEETEPELWRRLGVPGSPYAVAVDLDGTVLAKGTFNTPAQLESVLGTAERRRAAAPERSHA